MNKKADIGNLTIFLLILGLVFTYLAVIILMEFNLRSSENIACKDLGFKRVYYAESFDFCKSYNGDLHYVEFYGCNFWGNNCKARLIKVGEVEVAK